VLITAVPDRPSSRPAAPELVGRSPGIRDLRRELEQLAPSEVTLLLEGETGTGKELVAECVHHHSPRHRGPFVVFDCGAVAPSLIESDLFGHLRGAFTGAVSSRAGVFEQADGGTLFLDEIGELPRELQPKLLRLLERRESRRVGGTRSELFDVRVIAATNRDLAREVRQGTFREDLYYRIAAARLVIPPLRDRLEDLPLLIDRFLLGDVRQRRCTDLPAELWRRLRAHRWPGNVRELRNLVQLFMVNADRALESLGSVDGDLAPFPGESDDPVPPPVRPAAPHPLRVARRQAMEAFERRYLQELLAAADGNVSRAAALSEVSRQMLHRMIRRHRLHLGR
jgi:two-component system response regulator GlrR